mgnify:CR=1 FL=1
MSRVDVDRWSTVPTNSYSTSDNPVGYFSLKNDGDEAIVRFMYEKDPREFEVLAVHSIQLNNKYREVNCLRNAGDPIEVCPMCQAKVKLSQKFFIKMIQYVKDPATGVVTGKPVVWGRGLPLARTLKGYIETYDCPLSDMICKIIRHGAANNSQTTYEVIPNLSKNMYPDNVYIKDYTPFNDYAALGRSVLNKTADDMIVFNNTGSFPGTQPANSVPVATPAPAVNFAAQQPVFQPQPQQGAFNPQPVMPVNQGGFNPQPANFGAAPQPMPWEQPAAVNRPVRTY